MKIALLISMLLMGMNTEKPEEQLLPTKLRVTVIDGLGNIVQGASVTIYENEKDYRSGENAVATALTDKKGRVTFKEGLKLIPYYIEAKKGEQNNNGEGVLTGTLSEGKINKVNTVIE